MSKRFGRNQRRRAREEIAALTPRKSCLEADLKASDAIVRGQKDQIENVKYILGNNFIGLDPETSYSGQVEAKRPYKVEIDSKSECRAPSGEAPILRHCKQLDLDTILFKWQKQENGNGRSPAMHFFLETSRHDVFYVISLEELKRMPRDYLVGLLSRNFAKLIDESLKAGEW